MNKIRIFLLAFWIAIFPILNSCSSEKDIAARRNLMMPKKTDLPRNSKYGGTKKKKTYKPGKKKKGKRKKTSYIYQSVDSVYVVCFA